MTLRTSSAYFILREGTTHEEQWSRIEIQSMCESGQLTVRDRIFIEDAGQWLPLGETEFVQCFDDNATATEEIDANREALLADYKAASQRVVDDPGDINARMEAARLAADLDERAEARKHFQAILDSHPYHGRTAAEIRRRFSKSECAEFRLLDRPAPVWDDLSEILAYAISRGPIYLGVAAAVMALFSFIPFGGTVVFALALLWTFRMMREVAAGEDELPMWDEIRLDPMRELVWPAIVLGLVAAVWIGVFFGIASALMVVDNSSAESAFHYVSTSPIMIVLMAISAMVCFPAAFASVGYDGHSPLHALNPVSVVWAAVRMGQDYLLTVVAILTLGFVIAAVYLMIGWVPVLGKLVAACLLAAGLPISGFALGRMLARSRHAFR